MASCVAAVVCHKRKCHKRACCLNCHVRGSSTVNVPSHVAEMTVSLGGSDWQLTIILSSPMGNACRNVLPGVCDALRRCNVSHR